MRDKYPVDPIFQVHQLNEEGMKKAEDIAVVFDRCLTSLKDLCGGIGNNLSVPASREFSIVKTKMEEACFFAKKAMAGQTSNQLSKAA